MNNKNRTIRIGCVGAGFMGQLAHIQNYLEVDGCEIVALAEPRAELRDKVCQRYGIKRSYPTHKDLLKDTDVEAVVVVVARPNIGPIALDCLNAGKHLITEKPMAATLEQAQRLVETAERKNSIYSVGHMRRHDEGIQKAKEILDKLLVTNELGSIVYVRCHAFQGDPYCNADGHIVTNEEVPGELEEWPIAPDWIPEEMKKDYAWFLNTFCHDINMFRFLLDVTPKIDFTRLNYKKGRVVVFNFDEFVAVFEGGNSTSRTWDEYIEIHFEYGSLKIIFPPNLLKNVPARVQLFKESNNHVQYLPQSNWSWAFRRQAEAFINDIQKQEKPIASASDALDDFRLIENIWRAELNRIGQM